MPSEVTEVGPCKRRVTITISADEVKSAFSAMWRQARQNVQMKGFRPGKVPKAVLEKKYGDYVRQEVKQNLINDAYRDALKEHSLHPIASPDVDFEKLEIDPTQPVELDFSVEVRPEFELGEYKGITVGAPPLNVQDADVERELEQFRSSRASVEPIEEGVAAKGDYLVADVSYKVDNAVVQTRDDAVIDTNNDLVDQIPVEGGTSAFAGKKKGDEVIVPCHLPKEFEPESFAGAECELVCSVKEIRRVTLPDLTDEFATEVGAENLDDLKSKIREEVTNQVTRQRERYIEERVFDHLVGEASFELPKDMLDRSIHQAVHQLEHDMTQGGMDATEAKANAASHTERVTTDQSRGLRLQFIVDKIAEAEKLSVSDKELEQAIHVLAQAHQADVQQVYNELVDSGRVHQLRAQILESKVRKLLRESADVTDAADTTT